nr:A24 family peptidase [Catenibacterium mitsuokai]
MKNHNLHKIFYTIHIASLTCFYIISIIDLHIYEIPDIYLLISLLCSFKTIYLKESLILLLFLILFVYLFYKISGKEGLGGGDIKMLGVCSLSLGIYQTLSILSIACFLGIIFSFIKQKKMIPFGPFIALGWLTISLFDSFFIL